MPDYNQKQRSLQNLRAVLSGQTRFSKRASGLSKPTPMQWLSQLNRNSVIDGALFAQGLHEIVAWNGCDHAAALAFAIIMATLSAKVDAPFLIAGLQHNTQENGNFYGAGLSRLGLDPARVVEARARTEKELLWAVEEGASCVGLGAVIAVLDCKERLYGFTASRRIKLRQEKSGVPVFVVRASYGDATAATTRWLISTRPSEAKRDIPGLPLLGALRFSAQLIRYLGSPPQTWEIEFDASHSMRLVA